MILFFSNRTRRNKRKQPIRRQQCRRLRRWQRSARCQLPTCRSPRECTRTNAHLQHKYMHNIEHAYTHVACMNTKVPTCTHFWTKVSLLLRSFYKSCTQRNRCFFLSSLFFQHLWLAGVHHVHVTHTHTHTHHHTLPASHPLKTWLSDGSGSERNRFGALWSEEEREADSL